jgi:adenosylhomocysteine nucleosidase
MAVLAPMPSELQPLRAPLGLVPTGDGSARLFRGAAGAVEVVAALTGIGMRAGARTAERVLAEASPDWLVVVGIAGGIGASVDVGDLVVPQRVEHLESGESWLPERLGDAPPRGTLVSSDALLEDPRQAARLAERGVVAIDMETAAIAAVCARRGCPWSVFRGISDRADDGRTDSAILGLVGPDGRPRLAAAARLALTRPGRVPQLVRLAGGARRASRRAARGLLAALAPPAD